MSGDLARYVAEEMDPAEEQAFEARLFDDPALWAFIDTLAVRGA